ncbi:MAG: hypothetical protein NTY34_03550 [Candidatus Omnitrophica bacterium]|nr:hypothetical protein [Candidatus Omnitrophota bacterium]
MSRIISLALVCLMVYSDLAFALDASIIARRPKAACFARHCEADEVSRSNLKDGLATGSAISTLAPTSPLKPIVWLEVKNGRYVIHEIPKKDSIFGKGPENLPEDDAFVCLNLLAS